MATPPVRRARRVAGRVRRVVGRVRRVAIRPLLPAWTLARGHWARSLRLRVVATTTFLGLVVVLGVGNYLLERISDGLVESRQRTALREAERLSGEVQDRILAGDYTSVGRQEPFVVDLLQQTAGGAGEVSGWVFVRALRAPATAEQVLQGRFSGVTLDAIPPSLRQAVANTSGQQVQLTSLPVAGQPDGAPALAVGTVVDTRLSGPYELYYVFSLAREQQILDLVRRTFLGGGVALVLLVGAVAYVVTRQVVSPVQQAARTAEELASGRLDRRMRVRGQDDLARLARAFNEMAAGLERQIHQLEELSRLQRRFVSDVSHELRTPLTTIRMASEVIYEGRSGLDPVLSRSAELLQTQLDRFEALLADLLEISRFDAGAAVLETESGDVREVVTRVVEALAPLAERRGSALRVDLPADECTAEIDPRRLERVIRNLLANAIEHGEGEPVEVRVAATATAVAVAVEDHGVGLGPDELEHVFNRFWRADPARARSTGGTGLGLAIAQEDVHLHGGRLDVWGRPGIGATFRVTLPRRPGAAPGVSPLPLERGSGPLLGVDPAPGVAEAAGPDVTGLPGEPQRGVPEVAGSDVGPPGTVRSGAPADLTDAS